MGMRVARTAAANGSVTFDPPATSERMRRVSRRTVSAVVGDEAVGLSCIWRPALADRLPGATRPAGTALRMSLRRYLTYVFRPKVKLPEGRRTVALEKRRWRPGRLDWVETRPSALRQGRVDFRRSAWGRAAHGSGHRCRSRFRLLAGLGEVCFQESAQMRPWSVGRSSPEWCGGSLARALPLP